MQYDSSTHIFVHLHCHQATLLVRLTMSYYSNYPNQQYSAPHPPYQQNYQGQQPGGYSQNFSNAPAPYGPPSGQQGYPSAQQYSQPIQTTYPPQFQGSPSNLQWQSQQQHSWAPPAPPFDPMYNADGDVEILRRATKGFGTDEKALIAVLAQKSPAHTLQLAERFEQLVGKSLIQVIEKETSKWFCFGLVGCASGPLNWDVALLHRAMEGLGTHEDLLTELLIGRSNGEMNELKYAYEKKYHKALQSAVQGELSMKTERMFNMALTARRDEEYAPIDPMKVQNDIRTLYSASSTRLGTDEITVCGLILSRSDNHLRAVAHGYVQLHRKTVPDMITSEFSGHMKQALLHAINGAINRAARDAVLLEDAMQGMGTKDERLTYRVVRLHWDKQHTAAVKSAYYQMFGKDLIQRVKGETSGDYERLLIACLQ